MRNLLALVGLAAIAFVIAGLVQGWFTFNGNTIEVNTGKAREDIQKTINEGTKRVSQNPNASHNESLTP
ncbi:MAG: hypothetical protein ACKO26_04105 [Planctomycetota bacterium]